MTKIIKISMCIMVVCLCVSCTTAQLKEAKKTPLDFFAYFLPSLDASAESYDVYAALSISGNQELVTMLVEQIAPKQFTSDQFASELIKRTDSLYLATRFNEGQFKCIAIGDFPKSFAGFVFSKKNGWHKVSFKPLNSLPKAYAEYYQSAHFQAAVPYSRLVFGATFGIDSMLENLSSQHTPVFEVPLDVRAVFEQENVHGLRFYVPNPKPLINRLLGGLSLPVSYAFGSFAPLYSEDGAIRSYELDVSLHISESRFARVALTLLNSVLRQFSDISITTDAAETIRLTGLEVQLETIANIL